MSKFSDYEYRKQPGFDMNTFEGANQAVPMKTLVIHCFDPRAAENPTGRRRGDDAHADQHLFNVRD
jgi:carbonic anhydrase